MPFDRDSAIKAQQAKALKAKVAQAEKTTQTFKSVVKEARQQQDNLRRSDITRYYITTPLAQADDDIKGSAVKLEIQIPGGPTAYKDDEGKVIYREMGSLILLEGEGFTTDPLWAEWIEREFGSEGWVVSELRPTGLATYAQEIQEIKDQLQLQGV